MKSRIKLAIIRDNDETICPFGLYIADGCRSAGEAIDKMQPLSDEMSDRQKRQVIQQNIAILHNNESPSRCKYAMRLFPKKPDKVDCNYGDTAAGISKEVSFVGSPFYSQIFNGIGMGGLYNYPVSYQTDGSEYRNLYYGIYGWASNQRLLRSIMRRALLQTLQILKAA